MLGGPGKDFSQAYRPCSLSSLERSAPRGTDLPSPCPDEAKSPTSWGTILKVFRFFGPGAVISAAYIDPDNYQTAISSGVDFQYKLLFMIAASNIISVYLQVRSEHGRPRRRRSPLP